MQLTTRYRKKTLKPSLIYKTGAYTTKDEAYSMLVIFSWQAERSLTLSLYSLLYTHTFRVQCEMWKGSICFLIQHHLEWFRYHPTPMYTVLIHLNLFKSIKGRREGRGDGAKKNWKGQVHKLLFFVLSLEVICVKRRKNLPRIVTQWVLIDANYN